MTSPEVGRNRHGVFFRRYDLNRIDKLERDLGNCQGKLQAATMQRDSLRRRFGTTGVPAREDPSIAHLKAQLETANAALDQRNTELRQAHAAIAQLQAGRLAAEVRLTSPATHTMFSRCCFWRLCMPR